MLCPSMQYLFIKNILINQTLFRCPLKIGQGILIGKISLQCLLDLFYAVDFQGVVVHVSFWLCVLHARRERHDLDTRLISSWECHVITSSSTFFGTSLWVNHWCFSFFSCNDLLAGFLGSFLFKKLSSLTTCCFSLHILILLLTKFENNYAIKSLILQNMVQSSSCYHVSCSSVTYAMVSCYAGGFSLWW